LPDAHHGFALAHLAQHVEFTLAHKIILPLALDHFLEQLLAHGLVAVRRSRVQIRPVRGRIADELHHLGEQA
jgi:hypothetical protein